MAPIEGYGHGLGDQHMKTFTKKIILLPVVVVTATIAVKLLEVYLKLTFLQSAAVVLFVIVITPMVVAYAKKRAKGVDGK